MALMLRERSSPDRDSMSLDLLNFDKISLTLLLLLFIWSHFAVTDCENFLKSILPFI